MECCWAFRGQDSFEAAEVRALCSLPFLDTQDQSERVEFEIPIMSPRRFPDIDRFGYQIQVMVDSSCEMGE